MGRTSTPITTQDEGPSIPLTWMRKTQWSSGDDRFEKKQASVGVSLILVVKMKVVSGTITSRGY